MRPQVIIEADIVLKPPERWPSKDHVLRSSIPQALKFGDGGPIISRPSPVLSFAFKKRNDLAAANDLSFS